MDQVVAHNALYSTSVADPDGVVHHIPDRVIEIGVQVCYNASDPFDDSGAPSHWAMAKAYIAMEHALRSVSLPPIPTSLDNLPVVTTSSRP